MRERSISEAHCFADFEACKKREESYCTSFTHLLSFFTAFGTLHSTSQLHLCEVSVAQRKNRVGGLVVLFFFDFVLVLPFHALVFLPHVTDGNLWLFSLWFC